MRFIRDLAVAFLLFLASTAEAVTITSVTPASGPTSGGIWITLHGTDFAWCNCSPYRPPTVIIGDTGPTDVEFVDSTTLRAWLPPHPAGRVSVRVEQNTGEAELPNAFTYVGDFPEYAELERILLPLLTPPVFGAYGAEFRTDLRIEHRYSGGDNPVVYGLVPECDPTLCLPFDASPSITVTPEAPITSADVKANGSPGRFVYVYRDMVGRTAMNLRVHDVSRAGVNFGTEIPIVRSRDFVEPWASLVLLDVPADPRFRNTLRIYGSVGQEATIAIEGEAPRTVTLRPGSSPFEPAYAIFGDFPVGTTPRRVVITIPGGNSIPSDKKPFWAFITVTNNETQMITTITPRP